MWIRHLHHLGAKTTGKGKINWRLVERAILLNCLHHLGAIFDFLIIQALFDLWLMLHLDRHFRLNGIFIDFKGTGNAIFSAQMLDITGQITV